MTFVIQKMLLELLFHFPQKYIDNHILQTITSKTSQYGGRGMYCKIQDNLLCIERQKYCINKALIFVHFWRKLEIWCDPKELCVATILSSRLLLSTILSTQVENPIARSTSDMFQMVRILILVVIRSNIYHLLCIVLDFSVQQWIW